VFSIVLFMMVVLGYGVVWHAPCYKQAPNRSPRGLEAAWKRKRTMRKRERGGERERDIILLR
jgi:hypothetical protein